MNLFIKIALSLSFALGVFLIKQYRSMLSQSGEVTEDLKKNNYTIYTGKKYEESDLYDDRVFQETRCHYYDKFYRSGNVSPGMLKSMFKWKYYQKITKKDYKDIFTDISVNTGQLAQECAISYICSDKYFSRRIINE